MHVRKANRERSKMAGRLSLVVMCALLMVGTARAGTEVLELSDGDFQSIVEGADFAVVVFHAPWSVHDS